MSKAAITEGLKQDSENQNLKAKAPTEIDTLATRIHELIAAKKIATNGVLAKKGGNLANLEFWNIAPS